MAVFKCKMCGGALEIGENQSIATCEFCGTQQTLPKIDDEKKLGLFNRANALRLKSEFDKAAGIYETIIAEFPEEAEAYWGLVLCKYGIEYVDEGKGTRVPTCHRTVPTSIMEDADFDMACSNADATAKTVYREEAKAIDCIQKKILEIAAAEEPYDVFICYKETDDVTGTRTEDSAIAQDIYTELSKEGYKVFFARVTLRNKAGCDFEPYIYSALSSAKVMLVLGTKFDYFDAVWVKNEWSRYLSMMVEDKSKHLIPCYKGLDAYDIPKEFKNLQALNIGDVTFIKNLFENIGNFVSKVTTNEVVVNTGNAQIEPLLKRAFMFLEDGDWKSADEYCEKVLDIAPECAEAYLGKLMAELCIDKKEALKNAEKPFDNKNIYQKIVRYGNVELKTELEVCIEYIKDRNERARVEGIYRQAKTKMEQATEKSLKDAAMLFDSIADYKDAKQFVDICLKKSVEARKDAIYNEAVGLMQENLISSYDDAIELFEKILGWRDADDLYVYCVDRKKTIKDGVERKCKNNKRKKFILRSIGFMNLIIFLVINFVLKGKIDPVGHIMINLFIVIVSLVFLYLGQDEEAKKKQVTIRNPYNSNKKR